MQIVVHDEVAAVAAFLLKEVPAARLVGVATAVAALAPLLWGHHAAEEVPPLRIAHPAPTISDHGQRTLSVASG
jgi:hypothetical protein